MGPLAVRIRSGQQRGKGQHRGGGLVKREKGRGQQGGWLISMDGRGRG